MPTTTFDVIAITTANASQVALRHQQNSCLLKRKDNGLICVKEEITKEALFKVESGALYAPKYELVNVSFDTTKLDHGK